MRFFTKFALVFSIFSTLIGCGGNESPDTSDIISELSQPLTVSTGQAIVLEVRASDPDEDELSYTWSASDAESSDVTDKVFVPTTGGTAAEANKSARVNFSSDVAGTFIITVEIDDGNGGIALRSTFVKVVATNNPPVFDDVESILVTPDAPYYVGRSVDLTANVTDPDEDLLTYKWAVMDSEKNGVSGVLDREDGSIVRFTPDKADSYLITVVATDAKGGQDRGAAIVVVSEEVTQ